ncbi:MAG: STAS domain-containing protein [Cellulomonas sp.]|nr:STAS domain-containing protein [Cellulomonas sp.]
MELSVTSAARGDLTVVVVAGEVDVYTASVLREKLSEVIDGDHADVVVDLTGVGFLDSTGLGVLVGALKKVRGFGGRLQLVIDQEKVMKVFRITALTQVFTIHETLEAALET